MSHNQNQGEMEYRSVCCELEEENGTQEICVGNEISRLQHTNMKSESFIVDMETFSHSINKDLSSPNSRTTTKLQRSITRKGTYREGNMRDNSSMENKSTNSTSSSSPTAAIPGTSTLDKPVITGPMSPTGYAINSQIHHQITISSGNTTTTTGAESKLASRRLSFKRSSLSRTVDPRKILFYFATLSSMGSILLIYFTLTMGKFKGEDNAVNW